MQKLYPFKFLDSYTREDKDFFFGRNEEIETLYQMIFQTKIMMVYGTSGTGKTSLIQCGLANKFQTYDWLSLYIRRGSNIITALDKILCEESDEVFTYEENTEMGIENLAGKLNAVYKASFKPVYLIFDQFEELYILGTKQEQTVFIRAIKEILHADQPVKIIISIREEYLGYLYEFEKVVPELMRKKLRVEPMNRDKVKSVIKSIAQTPLSIVSLESGFEEAIAEFIFDKIRGDEKTLTIQLPYLQVFLDNLYLKTTNDESRTTDAVFTMDTLNKIGNIGDVLRNFLDEQVLATSKKLQRKPDDIWKILSPFVTLDGTKEPLTSPQLIERFPTESADLIMLILQAFVTSRILRYSEKDEVYEIAHDSLAKQVNAKRSDEEIQILEVQRLVKTQVSIKKEAKEYFSEKQLAFIEPMLAKFKVSAEEKKWIDDSREKIIQQKAADQSKQREELERTQKRLRNSRILLSVAAVAIIAAGIAIFIAYTNYQEAKKNLKESAKNLEKVKTIQGETEIKHLEDYKKRIQVIDKANDNADIILNKMDSLIKNHTGNIQDSIINSYKKFKTDFIKNKLSKENK